MTLPAAASAAASASLPFKAAADTALPPASQWGVALLLCCGALALVLWLLRRRGVAGTGWPRGRPAMVEILEARAVTPQNQLVVARYAGRQLLLSVGPAGIQCLRDDEVAVERAA